MIILINNLKKCFDAMKKQYLYINAQDQFGIW